MKTALVIGGTGMLADLSKELTGDFDAVGVIGRSKDTLKALASYSPKIKDINVDYSDTTTLKLKLEEFIANYGKPELIVSWVHSTSPEVPGIIAQYGTGHFFDITGESGKEKAHVSREREKVISDMGLEYHRVILGHIGNRWLTNEEISDGVLSAITARVQEYIVGVV